MLNKNNQRELAYVVRITKIEPIYGSDNCEAAYVNGWHVMVKKGAFNAGDLAVYFEIDSKVDVTLPEFSFLESRKGKIKTQRYTFGGKGNFISQGLLMSFDDFGWAADKYSEGEFLTKKLGVIYADDEDNFRKAPSSNKYRSMQDRHKRLFKSKFGKWMMKRSWGREVMFLLFGKKKDKRGWDWTWVSKSDQERCQNMPWIFNDQESSYIETTKIDGTSSTYVLEKQKFGKWKFTVCSRNVIQDDENKPNYHSTTENVYWQVAKKWDIEQFLKQYALKHNVDGVALQGETAGCSLGGVKLQGDPHKFGELRFFGYDLYVKGIGKTDVLEAKAECEAFGIEWVPVTNLNYIMPKNCDELVSHATGDCEAPGASGLREGYVYRLNGNPAISFKVVSPEYLLKNNK